MKNNRAKARFLRDREHSLNLAVECLRQNHEAIVDYGSKDLEEFADRLETCFREVKAIRAAIGDLADELWSESC